MALRRPRLLGALVICTGLIVGAPRGVVASPGVTGTITVSGAASLRDAFVEIGKAFRTQYPRVKVRFNFASSSVVVNQVLSGAPADVIALADSTSMDTLVAAGFVASTPRVFARNSMVIVVKPKNPHNLKTVTDLSRVGVVALCIQTAPCGAYAKSVLARAGVVLPESSVTRGLDATATLSQVVTGDAQAGIVYATDARSAGKSVVTVSIARSMNITAAYPIATLKGSRQSAASAAFVDFVMAPTSRAILAAKGFVRP